MKKWEDLVERKIREAMEEGAFDDLPGKGQPIRNLEENPFEDLEMRTAFRLLKNNNFMLPWIEERNEIEASVEGLRADLARSRAVYDDGMKARGRDREQVKADWSYALSLFRRKVSDLNRRIAAYNLKAPSNAFQRMPVDAEREIAKLNAVK